MRTTIIENINENLSEFPFHQAPGPKDGHAQPIASIFLERVTEVASWRELERLL